MAEISKSRKQRLRACERVLYEHLEDFVKVGMALKEIKDDKLYLEIGCSDFTGYLKSKNGEFEYSKRHAYQLIESAELRLKLHSAPLEHSPWTERSVRELKRLKSPTKAKAVAARVLKEVESDGGKLTSTVIRKAVDQELGTDRKPRPAPKLEFVDVVSRWAGKLNGIADVVETVPGDALELFANNHPSRARELAAAIERVEESLRRVWDALP